MTQAPPVIVAPCSDYSPAGVESALNRILAQIPSCFDVPPGGQIFLKPNLLMPRHPDECVTTHPRLVSAAGSAFSKRGFRVLIGDSPGGPLTRPLLERLYARTGMDAAAAQCGGELCLETGAETIEPAESTANRRLTIWQPVLRADALVNLCKLKTHGLTGLTGAVKNLFGCVPGMLKTEYHMNQPTVSAFSDALVDLARFLAPRLSVMDAVFAMEGSGPSHGRPRRVGLLLGSTDPFSLDYAVARMLGVSPEGFTTLAAALRKGYGPQSDGELRVVISSPAGMQAAAGREAVELLQRVAPSSFELLEPENLTGLHGRGWVRHALRTLQPLLRARPAVDETSCTRCATCIHHCPVEAVTMGPAGPRFDLDRCIRCFCCQELCPRGAIRIRRPWGSRLIYMRPTRRT
jgi:uncharacterized protein (DUF362 family)/Pyruvate/2-oxoacid:ferredoxin oxidoreductase delta subunit